MQDARSRGASIELSLTIIAPVPPPSFVGNLAAEGTVGVTYTSSVSLVDGVMPLLVALADGNTLPDGLELSLDSRTVTLSGVPTLAGTTSFTLVASDSRGKTAMLSVALVILPAAPSLSGSLSGATQGLSYSQSLAVLDGVDPLQLALESGSLPDDITFALNGRSVDFTGTPSAAGEFTFSLAISDARSLGASTSYTITVLPPVPSLTGEPAAGIVGQEYPAGSVSVVAGLAPFEASVASGSLPTGLSLAISDRAIIFSGVPTAEGDYQFEISVQVSLMKALLCYASVCCSCGSCNDSQTTSWYPRRY